jgi:hypothetical protein
MSNTYSWKIDALKCVQEPQPNYVAVAEWTVTGSDGTNTIKFQGSSSFSPNSRQTDNQQFVPYSNLTEAIVLQWVQTSESVADIEATLDNQLSNLVSTPVTPQVNSLPWA